jgi:hypothetical protein
MRGMCISAVICIMGEGQMWTMKCDLDTSLSSLRISKTGLMLMFAKTGSSLLMSCMKFSHMFCDLPSTRLSQFNSDKEKIVPDGFQECSQMSTSSYGLVNWIGGRLL